jgi:hypothetical protein
MKLFPNILVAVNLFATLNMAFGQTNDPFVGTFAGGGLTLKLEKSADGYSGSALSEGQTLAVKAQQLNANTIQGTYSYLGLDLPFQAQIQGNQMTLVTSAGESYSLTRQGSQSQAATAQKKAAEATGSTNAGSKMALAPGEVGDPYLGLKFEAPAGWMSQKTEVGYVLGSQTQKGFIAVLLHQFSSVEQLRAEAQKGIAEEGTMMQLDGTVQNFGNNGVSASFAGIMENQAAKAHAIGLVSPFGGGITILAAVEKASFTDEYKKLAESIARSTHFFKPEAPPVTPVTKEWRETLAGARLTYLWSYYSGGGVDGSYAGGSQKTIIDLCAQGYFNYADNNQMAVDGGFGSGYNASGYSGGSNKGNGEWEVSMGGQQPILRLKFYDGRVHEYVLSYTDKKTYLDDKRFFRTYAGDPIEEHRPQCW